MEVFCATTCAGNLKRKLEAVDPSYIGSDANGEEPVMVVLDTVCEALTV